MLPLENATSEADEFRVMLDAVVPNFLSQMTSSLLSTFDLDVATLQADHVCWRTASQSEYSNLICILQNDPDHFRLLIQSEIGGRPIATFALQRPITTSHHSVHILEIPSPKESSPYPAGLEHAEFVIGDRTCTSPWNNDIHHKTLQDFQLRHSNVTWNTKAMNKEVNPDVSVKITLDGFGTCSAKFHLMALEDVIAAEKVATGHQV
jgi:uncharacterized protein